MKYLKLENIWYENELGERWHSDCAMEQGPPGFHYMHSVIPQIKESIFDKGKQIIGGNIVNSSELLLAMCKPSQKEKRVQKERLGKYSKIYTYNEAAIILAISCARCNNVFSYNYGLDCGYKLYSKKWKNCNTSCDLCLQYESEDVKIKRIKELPGKIIFIDEPSEKLQIIAARHLTFLPENITAPAALKAWEKMQNMKMACE